MRRTLATLLVLAAWAACGGGPKPPPTPPEPERTPTTAPLGTSHFPGLDWGMKIDAAKLVYPGGTPTDFGWELAAVHYGRKATVALDFGAKAGGLERIAVTFDERFPSMEACIADLATVKAAIDETAGPSSVDNAAAYWTVEGGEVEMACNPDDDENTSASMYMRYVSATAANATDFGG